MPGEIPEATTGDELRRMFVAIELPEPIRVRLVDVQRRFAKVDRLRLTRPDQLHITLRFMGNLNPAQQAALVGAVNSVAATSAALDVVIRGIGAFPNTRRPQVIWAGVTPASGQAVTAVHRALDEELVARGFEPSGGVHRPHLTLARTRAPLEGSDLLHVQNCMSELRDMQIPPVHIEHLTVVHSVLSASGATHIPVATPLLQPR